MKKTSFGKLKIGDRFFLEVGDVLREYEKIKQPSTRNKYNMKNIKTGTRGRIGDAAIVKIKK